MSQSIEFDQSVRRVNIMGISLKPSEAVEGGGLLDDVNVELTKPRFEMWDYQGKIANPVPALVIDLVPQGDDEDAEPVMQAWSMGSAKDFVPSKDGKKLNPIGSRTAPNSSSNGMLFISSLVNSGFPEDTIEDDIDFMEGTVAHVQRQPAPKRPGLVRKEGDREPTYLAVTEIISLPGEKAKKKTGGKAVAKKSVGKKSAGGIKGKTIAAILQALEDNEGEVTKQQLPAILFEALKSDPEINEAVNMVFDDGFLGSGPWSYEDGVVTAS